ncbi:MAG: hypothetical protein HQK52_21405 [Oligoflexia bacterium]|nr:hypothetical protein [Oligoflexia bacterium]
MKKEYDFSKGVRGKYYKRFQEKNNIVVLEPEVAKKFPDSKIVNDALKELIKLSKFVGKKVHR